MQFRLQSILFSFFSLIKNMTEYFLIYQKWKQLNVAFSEGTEASMLRM